MNKFFAAIALALLTVNTANAQADAEGIRYSLPKTTLKISLLVEKTSFTPGELAGYSMLYMKQDAAKEPITEYSIVGISLSQDAIPDTARCYKLIIDKKHSIINLTQDENGVLLAVNDNGKPIAQPKPFAAKPQPKPLNPHDFMSQDILNAGSHAKMAQLIAQEIYDIRDSRNQLTRGEADFMPKDGEQMRIMLANLDTQERALMQVFQGSTVKDTAEVVLTYVPEAETDRDILFRFSKHFGVVDADDFSGRPFYISIEDLHTITPLPAAADDGKKSKEDIGLNVTLPGKIRVKIADGNNVVTTSEMYAAQFGRVEMISGTLFGKKVTTHISLHPLTGNIERLDVEPLE